MVDYTYTLETGDTIYELDWNNTERTLHGYGVSDGGGITINTGSLGAGNDTLTVGSGSGIATRAAVSWSTQAADLPLADSQPRWDLIGADDSGSIIVRSGTPEEPQIDGEPTTETHRKVHNPIPPSADGITPLALAWVAGGGDSIASEDLFDVRVPSDIFVSAVEVMDGGQVDGVDISSHASNSDAHHAQTHDNTDHTETYTIGNYEIQVDGTDGEGIINFHTQ